MNCVEQLEVRFAAQFAFAGTVAAGFGRSALRLALDALEVAGGEVLVPEFICTQVVDAVRHAGARPAFFPVERDLIVAPAKLRERLSGDTRAVILAHYFGRVLPCTEEIVNACGECGVPVIEDCALALGVQDAGHHGVAAVFSFTKSDWCYGGGLLATTSSALAEKARAICERSFHDDPLLAMQYGLLCRADFEANRPSCARAAQERGRSLQMRMGLRQDNFYDAGRFDARMNPLCARRALILLERLAERTKKCRAVLALLQDALAERGILLLEPNSSDTSSAFLLLHCDDANEWIGKAESAGVTLRRTWPAFQARYAGQTGERLDWFAEHLLILDVDPDLTRDEVFRIASIFSSQSQKKEC